GSCPNADDTIGVARRAITRTVDECGFWHLQGCGVDIETSNVVFAFGGFEGNEMGSVEGTQNTQVKDGGDVDKEGVIALTDKDFATTAQTVNARRGEGVVVADGAFADGIRGHDFAAGKCGGRARFAIGAA